MNLKVFYYYSVLKIINTLLSGTRFFQIKRHLLISIGIQIGKNSKIVGPIKIGSAAKLSIGDNCWIGTGFIVHGNGSVIIEDNCDLAPDITILTGSHEINLIIGRRAGKRKSFITTIGYGSWIGARTMVINGAKIGERVVVGANSLITKNCMNNSLYVGSPAKQVKEF